MISSLLITLIILGGPVLAVYSVVKRRQASQKEQTAFVYNGKVWVTWLWVVNFLSSFFLIFFAPIIASQGTKFSPDFEKLKIMLLGFFCYMCYVLIAYRPATAQEAEQAKASGDSVFKVATSATKSILSITASCLLGALSSLPFLIHEALNPVLFVKQIGNVTYKFIGTSITAILPGFIVIFLLLAFVAFVLLFGSILLALISTLALGAIAIVKFLKNYKETSKL